MSKKTDNPLLVGARGLKVPKKAKNKKNGGQKP